MRQIDRLRVCSNVSDEASLHKTLKQVTEKAQAACCKRKLDHKEFGPTRQSSLRISRFSLEEPVDSVPVRKMPVASKW